MKNIKFLSFLLFFFTLSLQVQAQEKSSVQSRTIEINNENGKLFISFEDGNITEFIVNKKPVSKERYNDYQEIIDAFSGEEAPAPSPSTPPTQVENEDQGKKFKASMVKELLREGLISSSTKYNIQLKRRLLKVDGQEVSGPTHRACLNIFEEIYGHELNSLSAVKFKKSKNNSISSISILK